MKKEALPLIENRGFKYGLSGMTLAIFCVPLLLLVLNPELDLTQKNSYCPLKVVSGIPCAGCGMTKALAYLYIGEFKKSWEMHAFAIPVLLYSCALTLTVLSNSKKLARLALSKKFALPGILLFLMYYGMRLVLGKI